MAYAAAVTVQDISSLYGGQRKRVRIVTIVETTTGAADEWTATIGWQLSTMVSYKTTLISGSGATVDPTIGNLTGPTASTQGFIWENPGAAAAHVSDQTRTLCPLTNSGILYGLSAVNAGADNVVHTEIVLIEGAI